MQATQGDIVLNISLLDHDQPVSITEAEVVRVRKKRKGLLLFNGS
jgi:hypothetical protein